MEEEIGALIGKGFGIWKSNLNLCIPFLLSIIFSFLALVPIIVAALSILGPVNIESLPPEQLLSMLMNSLTSLITAFILTIFLAIIVGAFFEAGAIGMARQAVETGKTTTDIMWRSGRKYFLRMAAVSILMSLITIAGMIFLLPGVLLLPGPLENIPSDSQALGLLIAGVILFVIYAVALSIILAIAPYALVIEDIGPVSAIKTSIKFFSYNKFDVFIIWIVVIAISIGLQAIGSSISVGTNTTAQPLSVITGLLNLLVLAPLSAVWWTMLYLGRTGKMIYQDGVSGGIHESK